MESEQEKTRTRENKLGDQLENRESGDQGQTSDSMNDNSIESPKLETAEKTVESIELDESPSSEVNASENANVKPPTKKRKRRRPNSNAEERNLLGRRALCKEIKDIAPHMLKTTKIRILANFLDSTKGLDDTALTERLLRDSKKLANGKRIKEVFETVDPDVDRRNLKEIIFAILLQEETHSLEESKLEQKVIEFEKAIVKESKDLDFFDEKKHDHTRWHHYDTYRIVLDAAWRNNNDISYDEACLLKTLRDHLGITQEEHWLIGCYLRRFPKNKCAIHTPEEVHDARKQLQKESILWSYRDQNNKNIDVIPFEIVQVLRKEIVRLELQETNYFRVVQHDSIKGKDLKEILTKHNLDAKGKKDELIERVASSDILPSEVLSELDRSKLADISRSVGLKSSGRKEELILQLIDFYDDLTFEERATKDEREIWFNNYELLASRSYADLRAKKLITKDLEVEHKFEKATDFLFDVMLRVKIDNTRRVTKADGRIPLKNNQVILWDCKSVESSLNLQDHLETQFDSYIRKESAKGNIPLAMIVIAPCFSSGSLKLAQKYKAHTNVDVALIHADALKFLADRWTEMEPKNSFPITLFNRTEIIDIEQVEFLLSLA